jgi:hypothetical protein
MRDQFAFIRGILIGMTTRASGAVTEGVPEAVKAAFPVTDILPVGFILYGSTGNAIFFSVTDER